MIKKIKEVLVLDNGFLRVFNDEVEFESGVRGHYFRQSLSERLPNYGVITICEYNGKIILLENFRYAHQKYQIETIKGMGMNNKTPIETATIEIEEEIGGILDTIEPMGEIKADLSDTDLFLFVAKIKDFKSVKHEDTESIKNIKQYSIEDIYQLIKENKIEDTVTLAALMQYIICYK